MQPQPPPDVTRRVLKLYGLALIVALVFFLCGFHRTSYAIQIGTWLALVAWVKLRGRQ
jgi:hypothetical protein